MIPLGADQMAPASEDGNLYPRSAGRQSRSASTVARLVTLLKEARKSANLHTEIKGSIEGEGMLRTLCVVATLQFLALTSAWACTGQVGAVIFQDTFADDSGGWDTTPPWSTVQPPVYVIAGDANNSGYNALNLTFNATDGDYCMDFILPPAIAANNQMYAGILFWATDYNNMMSAQLASDGGVWLQKKASGNWSTIFDVPKSPAFVSGANAVNSLRVTALAGVITVYLNGTQIKSVRAQEPTNPGLSFGMYAGADAVSANAPKVQIKSYSVTAGK